ncbi:prospero homeobox protein 1-like [Protopterus annectens]|uniref:prospero homeobox protein 1-like n=1 Tax=Protopterus annectens TaxID=7888 RepID=UPI001CFA244D|nr:prospero homeobox protein 1-like [Protopterus annectens]
MQCESSDSFYFKHHKNKRACEGTPTSCGVDKTDFNTQLHNEDETDTENSGTSQLEDREVYHQDGKNAEHLRDGASESTLGMPSKRSFEMDNFYNSFLQAKKARVEGIIRNINSSPHSSLSNVNHHDSDIRNEKSYRHLLHHKRYKSTQKQNNWEEQSWLKSQLEQMREQLLQFQGKLYQMYNGTSDNEDLLVLHEGKATRINGLKQNRKKNILEKNSDQELASYKSTCTNAGTDEIEKGQQSSKQVEKNLAEALKDELNTAVSQVVDSVVRMFAQKSFDKVSPSQLPHSDTIHEDDQQKPTIQPLYCTDKVLAAVSADSNKEYEDGQTEALSLVIHKTLPNPPEHISFSDDVHQQNEMVTNKDFITSSFHPSHPHMPVIHYTMDNIPALPTSSRVHHKDSTSADAFWEGASLRTKMSSRHIAQHPYPVFHIPNSAEGVIPGKSVVKAEHEDHQSRAEASLYKAASEGLTPTHLKKAKLMFFYTRYPSSTTLKIYFPDVKFNRCITSQLIKWFSNFREFFYIQMEKYSRQAVGEGVTSAEKLTIFHDCELARILNQHYNKSNDFQVPERFLEVSQITLREFFTAILKGKDSDPSWKKSIYKVICKLDSEIPAVFKSPNCLQEILQA